MNQARTEISGACSREPQKEDRGHRELIYPPSRGHEMHQSKILSEPTAPTLQRGSLPPVSKRPGLQNRFEILDTAQKSVVAILFYSWLRP
uniref:Uncharacterized protein n=1 Tax=Tetraselmis sp. GSL018 TaxID=582737 RepID=A0A061RP29_9CHLO